MKDYNSNQLNQLYSGMYIPPIILGQNQATAMQDENGSNNQN